MRFILMHKADPASEAGVPPTPELIAAMGQLMAETASTGTLLAAEGLQPSATRVRLRFSAGERTAIPGPVIGSNNRIAGFEMIRAASMDAAIDCASRITEIARDAGETGDIEIDIGVIKEPWNLGLCPTPPEQSLRFLLLHAAGGDFEPTTPDSPEPEDSAERLTGELLRSGICLAAERIQPGSKGSRLAISGERCVVTDGPFTESKEVIGGFVMLRLDSIEQAIAWATRFARVLREGGTDDTIEIDIHLLEETPGIQCI